MQLRQPATMRGLDDAALLRIVKRSGADIAASKARAGSPAVDALPREVGLQLTNRCNLRCAHCFQWGGTGGHHYLPTAAQRADLDFEIVRKVFAATRAVRSDVYVWGGEPLVYGQFGDFLDLLTEDPRWTVVCTNGIGLERHLARALPVSHNLVFLISLDGFASANDAIRGEGTFERTMASVDLLLAAQQEGAFRGKVSVTCVLSDGLAEGLEEFVSLLEAKRIDTLYLNYPWHISAACAERMDVYFAERFQWLEALRLHDFSGHRSWHGYSHKITRLDAMRAAVAKVCARTWRIRVRFQPLLTDHEFGSFLAGADIAAEGRSACISPAVRLNVQANGSVTMCKLFPEFTVGSLQSQEVAGVWAGEVARKVRSILADGLTPICSKCVQLYLCRATRRGWEGGGSDK